jgi:DNA-binding transcriptional regulator WhiA
MIFEDSRIERDFVSTMKKMESIEFYNFSKTKYASQKQLVAIQKIFDTNNVSLLNEKLLNLSNIRLKRPNSSLYEIQMEYNSKYNSNLSKSTINN